MRQLQPQQQSLRACPCSSRVTFKPAAKQCVRIGRRNVHVRSTEDFVDPITGRRSCRCWGQSCTSCAVITRQQQTGPNVKNVKLACGKAPAPAQLAFAVATAALLPAALVPPASSCTSHATTVAWSCIGRKMDQEETCELCSTRNLRNSDLVTPAQPNIQSGA